MDYLMNLWKLFVDMAFYISIGLLFTGILKIFVKKDVILKHIGKKSTSAVVKASVFGVPLPLCSCGVVPTALYLGKNGGSKGAVVSFLTSTPQTGVDSIIATYGLMGPLFAVYRAVAAFISGIIGGLVTNMLCKNDKDNFDEVELATSCGCENESEQKKITGSCCATEEAQKEATACKCSAEDDSADAEAVKQGGSCCCSDSEKQSDEDNGENCACGENEKRSIERTDENCCGEEPQENSTMWNKVKSVFVYAFGEFLDDIAVHFVVGLLIAALIDTFVPNELLASFTNPIVTMLFMLIIGIPMYICSTASIPIALTFIVKGVSPGAAFVFLFAGPVTNIVSLSILGKALGKKVLAIYLACAAVCAIVFGLILDFIIDAFNYTGLEAITSQHHEYELPLYMVVVALVFGCVLIKSLVKYFKNKLRT